MGDTEPTVPYDERPEKFLLVPWKSLPVFFYPGRVFEWGWKKAVHIIGPEYLAEFWGTMIFMTFAMGSVAQAVYSRNPSTAWIGATYGGVLGIIFGLYTCAGVSGGHINSAITIALGVTGRFPLIKVPFYCLAQFLGSFVASFLVFLYYYDAMNHYDNGSREFNGLNETFRIWITNPQDHVSNLTHFWDQFWSTFLFLFLILASFDRPNIGVPHSFKPISVGLIVFALSVAFGYNCGGGVNPIRDFPPRCFVAIMWGADVFKVHDYYFFIPIFAPILGGTVGTIAYAFFIETHHYPASKPLLISETNDQEANHPNKVPTSFLDKEGTNQV